MPIDPTVEKRLNALRLDLGGVNKRLEYAERRVRAISNKNFVDKFTPTDLGEIGAVDTFLDFRGVAVPANPDAGYRRAFANIATSKLSIRTSTGTTINLEYGDAEAIVAVEGEATLDLTGEATIASGKSLTLKTDGSTGGLKLGSAGDAVLYRGAANKIYVGTGDSLRLVSGTLETDLVGEVTGGAGVTVDGLLIKDATLVSAWATLTVAAGQVTRTQMFHEISGQGAAADDLVGIAGGADGMLLVVHPTSDAVTITVKHADAGGESINGTRIFFADNLDKALDDIDDLLMLIYDSGLDSGNGAWIGLIAGDGGGSAHNVLSLTHSDTLVGAVVDGDVIIGNATPKWSRLAISIPAANIRNMLGIDNGELRPSWKTTLDTTNPADIAATAGPGTSLIFAHRDHVHAHPDLGDLHTGYLTPTEHTAIGDGTPHHVRTHNLLESDDHPDVLDDVVTDGDIIIGNVTPKWSSLAVSVPAANVLNVLGVANAELRPSWKAALDAVNPAGAGGAASPGTSLVFSHRDHVHAVDANHSGSEHHAAVTIGADAAHSLAAQVLSAALAATGQTGHMSGAMFDKLAGIEALADVTDAANVAAAGAVMDSDISPGEGFLRKTGAGAYTAHKSNLAAAAAPGVNDDAAAGYSVGSIWINTTNDDVYVCVDATNGAAVWPQLDAASAAHDHTTADGSGVLTNDEHDGYSEYGEIATPSAPAANKLRLYAKDVSGVTGLAFKDAAGAETTLVARIRYIWVPARDFDIGAGAPPYTYLGSWGNQAFGWRCSDGLLSGLIGHTALPADWGAGTVTAHILYQGGGSGYFRIEYGAAAVTANDSETMAQTVDVVDVRTVFSYNNAMLMEMSSAPLTVAAGDFINMRFARLGADAADTSPNDLFFFGVRLTYTAFV